MKKIILGLYIILALNTTQVVGSVAGLEPNLELLEKRIATFPITEPWPFHQQLFNELLDNKSEDRIDELVAVANSAVTGMIHPYEYYRLL